MRKPQTKKAKFTTLQDEFSDIDRMEKERKQNALELNFKINCKFKNEKQKLMYDTVMSNRITIVKGAAGTGKTLIALMAALNCVKDKKKPIDQIILTKPVIEVSRSLGALPGDLTEKTLCYYTHFYDNLIKLIGNEATKHFKTNGLIKETVLNYVRGSTFGRYDSDGKPIGSFCIFDETQNTTIIEMKTFISRMGENSKLVILGDNDQVDIKMLKGEKTGLHDAWDRLNGIDGIGFVEFTEDDIVRDPFLVEIMKRYKNS